MKSPVTNGPGDQDRIAIAPYSIATSPCSIAIPPYSIAIGAYSIVVRPLSIEIKPYSNGFSPYSHGLERCRNESAMSSIEKLPAALGLGIGGILDLVPGGQGASTDLPSASPAVLIRRSSGLYFIWSYLMPPQRNPPPISATYPGSFSRFDQRSPTTGYRT
jgi:hypothetical protein